MINIRSASVVDLEQIQQLNHQVMTRNVDFDPDINPDFDLEDSGREYFRELVENEQGVFLVAIANDKFVGYINGSPKVKVNETVKTFELENLGVLPEYRRQGVATQLYKQFISEIKHLGYAKIYLNCYYHNQPALDFYRRQGFEPIDISLVKHL